MIILSGFLVFTYWHEELGGEKKRATQKEAKALFQNKNLGQLKSIKFPKFNLVIKDGKYFTKEKNYPADKKKTEKLIEVLSSLEVVSIIDKEKIRTSREHFFPQEDLLFSFQFERGELSYRLGAKLDYSQEFYVEVGLGNEKNLVVAKDSTPQYGVYQEKSLETSAQKYSRFKYILSLREKDLFDTDPFKNNPLNLGKVIVENARNKKFEIDFIKKNTNPVTFKNLSYKESLFDEYAQKLTNLKAIDIHFDPISKDLSNLESTVAFPLKASLYKTYKGREGYFLKVEGDKDLYELSQKDSTLFFTNVQDFWNKEIINPEMYHTPATFIFEGKPKVSVRIKDSKPFEVQSFDAPFNINQNSFKKIYSLLLNPAERVLEIDHYLKEDLKKSLFNIQVNDLMFKIFKIKNELLFVNEKDKLVYIYDVGMENPIEVKFENYFYRKK